METFHKTHQLMVYICPLFGSIVAAEAPLKSHSHEVQGPDPTVLYVTEIMENNIKDVGRVQQREI